MKHSDAVNLVLVELSSLQCLVTRRDVGMFLDTRGNHRRIGVSGEADVQGTRPPDGRSIGVEVKVGTDRPKQNQKQWATAFTSRGGLYAVVRPDKPGWKEQLRALVGVGIEP